MNATLSSLCAGEGMNMHNRLCTLLALCLGATCANATAESALFDSVDPIAVTLIGPFAALARDRAAEPTPRDATLVWSDAGGGEHRIAIQLQPRGLSRRNPESCSFPPLRIEFAKDAAAGTPFAALKKVKLVTHCTTLENTDHSYTDRLWLELLVYRIFNRLTDVSFRVRPLDVTYVDTDHGARKSRHDAFLIEPDALLAARTQTKRVVAPSIPQADLDVAQASRVGLFAYLIGNTDFAMTDGPQGSDCCHNVVPLRAAEGPVLPVPYDFDATGIVDPPYAVPAPQLHTQTVKQRVYRGYCEPDAQLNATLEEFRAARADIRALFTNETHLTQGTIAKSLKYLDEFYAIVDDPKALEAKIVSRCLAAK